MGRVQLNELTAFAAVAEHRSFTKAAARLGISKPSMSLTINALEQRLGVRLFNRTTRNVALTVAGERLFAQIQPILEGLDQALDSLSADREFLTRGGVFTDSMLDAYIELKTTELQRFRQAVHPIEFEMYYSL